jgi:hypothetical protein
LAYLKEAAKLYPDCPAVLSALVSAQMAAGRVDESTLAYASELARLDPTNALRDCYAAQCQFQSGDILGALQSLAQASAKGHFTDDRIATLMARRDYWLHVMVRRRPGTAEAQAKASLEVLWRQHTRDHPPEASDCEHGPATLLLAEGRRGPVIDRGLMGGMLRPWMEVGGLLLLMACANRPRGGRAGSPADRPSALDSGPLVEREVR